MDMHTAAKPPMSTELQFSDFINPLECRNIVDNSTFSFGDWNQICKFSDVPNGVAKQVIPVDLRPFCMMVITKVDPGTHVPKHAHDEGIIRFVTHGSLRLNGQNYSAGDWVFVPYLVPYEISTDEGYTVIAGYYTSCNNININESA